MSDSSFLAAILLFERGCLQLELSCCRTPHPYVEFFCLAQTVLSLKQERIDYQPRPQGAEASEKRLEDEVARLYQEPITVITHLAWSRRSDSRARRSIRSELNYTPGKRGASSLALAPHPLPRFPRVQFNSLPTDCRALLSESLEQATTHCTCTRSTYSVNNK